MLPTTVVAAWAPLVIALLVGCQQARDARPDAQNTAHAGRLSDAAVVLLLRADSTYQRDFDSARVTYDSAIAVARHDGDSSTLARALTGRGNAAWRLGRYDEAKRIGDEALGLKKRLRLTADLTKSYASLGLLAQARGEFEEAESLLVSGLAAAQDASDSAYIAKSHNNLGLVRTDLGEFESARSELNAARALAAARGEHRVEVSAGINLGKLELEIGDPAAALPWLSDARTRSATMKYFVGEENALGQLARAHAFLGEPTLAIAHLDSALAIARTHGLKEPETDDLELMAELYQSAGQYQSSLRYLASARALSDTLGMLTKLAHVSLAEARAYAALGNLPMATARATALIARLRREGARAEELEAELFAAELAQKSGNASAARARLDTAAAIASGLGSGLARARVSLARARVLDAATQPTQVITALQAMRPDTLLLSADEQAERDGLLARAHLRLGHSDSAIAAGRAAVTSVERIRRKLATSELRTGYTADRATIYADLVVALLMKGAVNEAFRVADAARGRTLTERLGAETRELRTGARPEAAQLRELLARIELLTARLRATDSVRSPERGRVELARTDALTRQLVEARREYEAMLVRVAHGEPSAAILGATTVDAPEIQRTLARDEALVEFFSMSDRLVTFVLTRDRILWSDTALTSTGLAEYVRSARSVTATRYARDDAPLLALYAQLIAPLQRKEMLQEVRSLVIVPHGALAYLPFAALARADSSGRRYLVEDFTILTIASASALPALRAREASVATTGATVLAPLPIELPASGEEARTVAASYAGASPVIGRSATEKVLRTALTHSALVHVATHGLFDARSPMFSGIQLVASSDRALEDDDGRLETHEVLTMSIRSQLVFLSGCETALGASWSTSYERTEDYATLAQAFLFAGARNVIATMWPIEDRSAAELAGRFYRALASASPPEALAIAQRGLIRSGRYRRPYFWAPYVVSGSGTSAPPSPATVSVSR